MDNIFSPWNYPPSHYPYVVNPREFDLSIFVPIKLISWLKSLFSCG